MIINNHMFIETDIDIIIDTLSLLQPNDIPEWGMMSSQRMIEHLTDTVNLSFNEHNYTLQLPIDKVEKAQRFIFSEYELPKNFKASFASSNVKLRNESIDEAIIELEESWVDMIEYFKNNPESKTLHPHFGLLNAELWLRLHSKHFTHHFLQFNLINK